MATVQQQEFDIGASLRGLYKDLPYVAKLGYSVGEMGERILGSYAYLIFPVFSHAVR